MCTSWFDIEREHLTTLQCRSLPFPLLKTVACDCFLFLFFPTHCGTLWMPHLSIDDLYLPKTFWSFAHSLGCMVHYLTSLHLAKYLIGYWENCSPITIVGSCMALVQNTLEIIVTSEVTSIEHPWGRLSHYLEILCTKMKCFPCENIFELGSKNKSTLWVFHYQSWWMFYSDSLPIYLFLKIKAAPCEKGKFLESIQHALHSDAWINYKSKKVKAWT